MDKERKRLKNQEWHKKNRKSQLQKMKARYERVKNDPHTKELQKKAKTAAKHRAYCFIHESKIGNPCNRCGMTCKNSATHDWHHKNPKDKRLTISQMMNQAYSVIEIEKEIQKCELLCRNCHALTYHSKY